jgi:hypothetical protein
VEPGQRAAIEVLLAPGLAVPSAIASLPYSRVPGEHIGVGDRWQKQTPMSRRLVRRAVVAR